MLTNRFRRITIAMAGLLALSTAGLSLTATAQAATKHKTYNVAYLSYGVANSYDAPMLAAARAVAATSGHVNVTVFDSQSTYTTQVSELQDVVASGKYQGIIVQPVYGAALIPGIKAALKKHIKVVNIDQILGSNYASDQIEVKGLSGNVVFFPSKIGKQLGQQAVAACAGANPCKIALVHNYKGYEPDSAISTAFASVIASNSNASVVAEGDGLYTPSVALTFVADTLVAHPDLNVIVGADQDCEGAQSALTSAHITTVKLVCYGASATGIAAVKSGAWYSDVAQLPATEGQLGMIALIKALKTGKNSGSQNPVAKLPNNGIVIASNAGKFTGEWPG
ncbi:MAG: sugar ABC transporter substrate-binding protein [Acidimicrobiales bacterium]